MHVLGIETSTPVCSAGLADDDRVVVEYTLNAGLQHAERLLPMVQRVLEDAGLEAGELDGVAVGAGPGSFTGLRVGMGTAKGLCMACNLPLLTVPTLEGIAFCAAFDGLPVCAMLDARRGQVYAGVYGLQGGALVSVLPDRVLRVSELLPDLPRPALFAGQGARAYREEIAAALGADARFAAGGPDGPSGAAVALLGARRLLAGEVADLSTAEPQYLRRAQAERAACLKREVVSGG